MLSDTFGSDGKEQDVTFSSGLNLEGNSKYQRAGRRVRLARAKFQMRV